MARNIEEDELIRRAMDGRLLDVRTSMAATVVDFDANTMTATIQPGVCVQGVDPDTVTPEVDELPPVEGVPVLFPHCGEFILYAPLSAGDVGRLEWSEEDDGEIYADADAAIPVCPRVLKRHGAQAVFRPEGFRGAGALGAEDAGKLFLGKPGGGCVQTDGDEVKLGRSDASDFVVLADKLEAAFGQADVAAQAALALAPAPGGTPAAFKAFADTLVAALYKSAKVLAK